MPSFGFIPYMVSEKKILKQFYENQPFLPPQQPIKFTDLDKSHRKRRGLLNKHFCKKIQISPIRQIKLSISSFPTISLWELKVAIATRVLIRLEQKHNYPFPLPIDAIYKIEEELAQRLQRRSCLKMLTTGDGRTDDGYLYILKAHL